MLLPKRVKYRRVQRGRMTGKAMRGNTVTYGEFGLVATEPAWITSNQIEAARIAMTRYTKRGGQVWIKIFPDKPVTQKPAETRMGSGKGSPEYWVAVVKPGRVMFEIAGDIFGDAGDLKHDTAGLNNGNPILRGALTGTHTGLSRLLSDGLIGEDLDPDLTATLGVTGHGDTGGLDLIAGDPGGLSGDKTEFTVGDGVAAHGLTGHTAALHATILYSLRQKH